MAVEVHTNRWPVKARGDLFDVGGFTRTVVALDHHATIELEASKNSERGVGVKFIRWVDIGDAICAFLESFDGHI